MLEKAKGYGYHEIGFILDHGCFSRENIGYMDKNGFDFIIMMKGMKSLVHQKLFPSDEKDRYFIFSTVTARRQVRKKH